MRRSRDFVSHGAEETRSLGRRLGERLEGGAVVLLFGQLGTGKTVFVRGLAEGMGLSPEEVRSPSFTLIHEHSGALTLYHVDLYRLGTDELRDVGLEDLPGDRRVIAVEWADRLEKVGWDLGDAISVTIDYHPDAEDSRCIVLEGEEVLIDLPEP